MIGIYKFTNQLNNKSYIGQSIDIEKRKREHLRNAYNYNLDNSFYQALRKYGIINFSFEILEECEKERLNEREIYWIQYYDTYKKGYNMTPGGDFNPSNVPEIVQKRTEKLLNDEKINAKLSHKGEDNGNAKLTKVDVIEIRKAYAQGKQISEVYPLYQEKISYSGFQACWLGKSWKEVMPEVFQQRKAENNGGSKTSRNEIYQLRLDYMNGLTNKELQNKYNKTYETVRRIIKMERWNQPETIPNGYIEFISK